MFALFLREFKKVILSLTFLTLVAAILLMVYSQDVLNFNDREIKMPHPGQNYGMQTEEIPEIIMPAALTSLYSEYKSNSYTAYPIGFYKNVKLNNRDQQQVAKILSMLTGISLDELIKSASVTAKNRKSLIFEDGKDAALLVKDELTYEKFKSYMKQVDKLIGGGSNYSETFLINFGKIPITYEEAVASYHMIKDEDHFLGAYARLFSDYMVTVLSILPVFVAIAISIKDKRFVIHELIYTRKISSVNIILIRYISIITAIMIPVMVISYISNMSVWSFYDGMKLDYLAPLKYNLGWILPSVMISAAVGMFFTELTNTAIGVAVQGLWWFIDINRGIAEVNSSYSLFRLSPRHNSLANTQTFIDHFYSLIANRLFFIVLALIIVAATILIYEQKRRGKLNGQGKLKLLIKKTFANMENSQSKSEA
ncbi:hypothetical protein [Cytobacillus sp.]|uniref:hypothetical protein n=1 Tax=Cytobacillus sp. TaxID=2675269 RepID=UPI0028BDACD4|nr:hypothetical protein [Cytobacillus sp.]